MTRLDWQVLSLVSAATAVASVLIGAAIRLRRSGEAA